MPSMEQQRRRSTTKTTTRRRVVVDNSALAQRIGGRLRRARVAAGMTQAQLASDRYSKAYISALETGQAKPSMAALNYLAERLACPVARFLDEDKGPWRRLEADLALAAGRFAESIDAYREILEDAVTPEIRGGVLGALAEAYAGLDRGAEAIAAGAEAVRLLAVAGREAESAIAAYWLAVGQYQVGNPTEAEAILQRLLGQVRAGLRVEPDFAARILMALSSAASREGRHAVALGYLEEVRGGEAGLDDRRRGAFLYDLAYSYRETGDLEAALRTGTASLALFRAAGYDLGMGALENDLALSYLALDNTERAQEMADTSAGRFERLGAHRWLAHVEETRAQIALARGEPEQARALAESALALADETHNDKAAVSSLRTLARIEASQGRLERALEVGEAAAARARATGSPGVIRDALRDLAQRLADAGRHAEAFAVLQEAMAAG